MIRGKYPRRRTSIRVGNEIKYIYQNLKLKERGTAERRIAPGIREQKETPQVDMSVSEYLENELLDINDLKKCGQNYAISIQVQPTQKESKHSAPRKTWDYELRKSVNPGIPSTWHELSTSNPEEEILDLSRKVEFSQHLRSVISAGKKILSSEEGEDVLEIILERAVIEENPAVSYETNSSSCSVAPALKDLEMRSPERVINSILHHQSCIGLGCSSECRTLRAAYIHIVLFQHKCNVWNSFYKIIAKHAKRCRQVSCGIEFCHFAKHEMHIHGISILPMQLLKARSAVEEEFRKCEQLGVHQRDFHCRHFPPPKIPNVNLNLAKNDQFLRYLNHIVISAYPDTPFGITVRKLVAKTVHLLKNLFTL